MIRQGKQQRSQWSRAMARGVSVCFLAIAGCGVNLGLPGQDGPDSDGDGLSDARELRLGTDPDNPDTDADGVDDGDEIVQGTSPLVVDSDNDGLADNEDTLIDAARPSGISVSSGNDIEPNDSLGEAVLLPLADSDDRTFEGRIDVSSDVDVFDLGPLSPGDHITATFTRRTGSLRPTVAILDDEGAAFLIGEDPFISGGPSTLTLVDEHIRHAGSGYRLAIANRGGAETTGAYRVEVVIDRDGSPPLAKPQTVFLDFDGGVLAVPLLGVSSVAPFDAGEISSRYAGEDDIILAQVITRLEEAFADFNVTIITSNDQADPPDGDITTLLFGSFHESVFGVSVGVDPYNLDQCDDGAIFTESFRPAVFGFPPRAEALGFAIGNVAAHEIGHLLGLNHVTDSTALMDERSPAIHLLTDQVFKLSPLSRSVFPLGSQDAPWLLEETVGLAGKPE